jgi:hypothetical protein
MDSSLQLLKEYIRMAITPMPDPRTGSGYSHLGKAVSSGSEYKTHSTFPYKEEPEELDDVELPLSDEELDLFLKKTLLGYTSADPIRKNVGDRFAFVTGATKLGEDITYQRIFTIKSRTQKGVPGTKRGLSSAPEANDPHEENDEPVYNLKDLAKKLDKIKGKK